MWIFIIIFFASLVGLWNGFDTMRVAYFSKDQATFSIKDVEDRGIGGNRFTKVEKAIWDGSYVYEVSKKEVHKNLRGGGETVDPDAKVPKVIIPLLSQENFQSQSEGARTKLSVLAKYEMPSSFTYKDLENWRPENTAGAGEEFSVSGVTLVGLNSIDKESKNLISTLEYEISPEVVFLNAGSVPGSFQRGLVIFAVSGIAFLASLLYFLLLLRGIGAKLQMKSDVNTEEITTLNLKN